MIKFISDEEILLGSDDGDWLSIQDMKEVDEGGRFLVNIEDDNGEFLDVVEIYEDDVPELITWFMGRLTR